MNANYSEALEQQIALLRDVESGALAHRIDEHSGFSQERSNDAPLTSDDGNMIVGLTHHVLSNAAPFYWDLAMVPLLERAAQTMPRWILREDDPPCAAGFLWFGKPLSLPGMNNFCRGLSAVAWDTDLLSGYITVTGFLSTVQKRADPAHWIKWRFGEAQPDPDGFWGPEITKQRAELILRYAAAAFSLLGQRIVSARSQMAERHVRKRAEREGWANESLIRIVELRRRERLGERQSVETAEHEWSCQWVVRGHWRQQPYPKAGAVRPKWITPYVKGPEDKPLKPPRATVFAVVR